MEYILIPTTVKSPMVIEKCISNQLFICEDYTKLSALLAERLYQKKYVHDLAIDWTYCKTHPLTFDIIVSSLNPNTFDILINYYENVFIKIFKKHICLSKMKILLSMCRNHSGGMRIHVLDVEMFHDDYIHLCNLMRNECVSSTENYYIKLICDSRQCLVGCDKLKNENKVYVPIRQYHYPMGECIIPDSENKLEMASSMMPIPQKDVQLIYYPTRIVRNDNDMACAQFKSVLNNLDYFIQKENTLKEGKREPFCYDFFKRHGTSITSFSSSNSALNIWYDRERVSTCNKPDLGMFQSIDDELRQKCYHLKDDESPLSTVLQSNYCLPVFYALCNMNKHCDVTTLIDKIYNVFPVLHELPNHLPEESTHLNFETILYCARHTPSLKTKEGFYYSFMEDGWDWIFESTESVEELEHYTLTIQKNFYPVVKCLKDLNMYCWDPWIEKWISITEKDIKETIEEICQHIKWFKGFEKLPSKLKPYLEFDFWIEKIVESVLNDNLIHGVNGNLKEMTDENFNSQVYGCNVPQYYFLNYKPDFTDVTCCKK